MSGSASPRLTPSSCESQPLNATMMRSVNGSSPSSDALVDTMYVQLTVYPFLLVLCTLGNIVNLLVLSRLCKVRMKEVLLMGLAVSDTLIMWLGLPRYLDHHGATLGLHAYPQYPRALINGFGFFTWTQYTFYYVSDWILILFSCERLIAFRYTTVHRFIRGRLLWASLLLLGVVLLSSLTCLEHLVWYYHWLTHRPTQSTVTATAIEAQLTLPAYRAPDWLSHWDMVQTRADIALPLLTSLTLLMINTWLLVYLKKRLRFSASFRQPSSLSRRTSGSPNHTPRSPTAKNNGPFDQQRAALAHPALSQVRSDSLQPNSAVNMDALLLGCVALYFLTQFPTVVFNLLEHLAGAPYCLLNEQHRAGLGRAQPVVSTLSLLNYSGNFLVYAGLNRKYRQLSMELVCGRGRSFFALPSARRRASTLSGNGLGGGAHDDNPTEDVIPLLRLSLLRRLPQPAGESSLLNRQRRSSASSGRLDSIRSTSTRRSTLSSLGSNRDSVIRSRNNDGPRRTEERNFVPGFPLLTASS